MHSTRVQSPIEPVDFSGGRISPVAKTLQIETTGPRESSSVFHPVQSTEIIGAPTVPIDIPTREETTQAFAEVSSVLRSVSTQHDEVLARGCSPLRVG